MVDLKLTNQNLTDENIVALAEVLKDDQKIWRLDLSKNKIGDIGAKALAAALKTNSFICTNGLTDIGALDLCDNPIGKEGFKAIMSAIKETGRLMWTVGLGPIDLGLDEEKDKAEIEEIEAIMRPLIEEQNAFRSGYNGGDCILS